MSLDQRFSDLRANLPSVDPPTTTELQGRSAGRRRRQRLVAGAGAALALVLVAVVVVALARRPDRQAGLTTVDSTPSSSSSSSTTTTVAAPRSAQLVPGYVPAGLVLVPDPGKDRGLVVGERLPAMPGEYGPLGGPRVVGLLTYQAPPGARLNKALHVVATVEADYPAPSFREWLEQSLGPENVLTLEHGGRQLVIFESKLNVGERGSQDIVNQVVFDFVQSGVVVYVEVFGSDRAEALRIVDALTVDVQL